MNIILLSGGSGQRLWPLSNEIRSKQFIKIFHTADGGLESMVCLLYTSSTNPLPWYYLPKLIVLTIPVYLSVLLWSSIGIWIYKGRKHQWDFADRIYPMFALTSGIPVLAAMLCDPNLYNGWRHMYFIYGPMIVMMA